MRFLDAKSFTADRPWGAVDIVDLGDASVRLHWTDQLYVWHVNDGPEVFVLLDGAVDMHYRRDGQGEVERLVPGRICFAESVDEHVARPAPEARILVIERKGQHLTAPQSGALRRGLPEAERMEVTPHRPQL